GGTRAAVGAGAWARCRSSRQCGGLARRRPAGAVERYVPSSVNPLDGGGSSSNSSFSSPGLTTWPPPPVTPEPSTLVAQVMRPWGLMQSVGSQVSLAKASSCTVGEYAPYLWNDRRMRVMPEVFTSFTHRRPYALHVASRLYDVSVIHGSTD